MSNEIQPIKKIRGHRKENKLRNQALVSLRICGMNYYQISKVIGIDRRNVHRFIKLYYSRYSELILENIKKHFLQFKDYIQK